MSLWGIKAAQCCRLCCTITPFYPPKIEEAAVFEILALLLKLYSGVRSLWTNIHPQRLMNQNLNAKTCTLNSNEWSLCQQKAWLTHDETCSYVISYCYQMVAMLVCDPRLAWLVNFKATLNTRQYFMWKNPV